MRLPSPGLQTKLTLILLGVILAMVVVFLWVALNSYRAEQQTAFELRARSLAAVLGAGVDTIAPSDILLTQTAAILRKIQQQPYVLYSYIYDRSGRVLADGLYANPRASPLYGTILKDPLHLRAVAATAPVVQYRFPRLSAPGNVLEIAQPVVLYAGQPGGLEIGFSLASVRDNLAAARRDAVLFGLLFAAIGAVLSAVLGRHVTGPIQALVRGTRLVAAGDLDVEITPSSRDEIGLLADSFNGMTVSLRRERAALQRRADEAATLYLVGQEIARQVALEPTLHLIVEKSRALLEAEASLLALREDEGDTFAMRALSGPAAAPLGTLRFRVGEGLGGEVAATGQPVTVGDYAVEFAGSPFAAVVRDIGLRSQIAVPLKARAGVVGVLYVASREPRRFGADAQALLSSLADHAAIAIENAKLYEAVRRHAEDLEGRVQTRTQELREVNEQLVEASRHKSQFLANMSHELRTPLNAILGYTELVLDDIYGPVPAKIRGVLERLQRSGRHLLGLINDVLDLSKMEAGKLVLALGEYSLRDVVDAAVMSVESLAAEKGLVLKNEVAPELPRGVGDERRIAQVVLNLVGNAIKFTDTGEVTVRAAAEGSQFVITVSDTGPGIPEEDRERIFEEFRQVDGSSTRAKGGTGLGLSIARRIVELHGGRMWVVSAVGRGSTFAFALPLRAPQSVPVP